MQRWLIGVDEAGRGPLAGPVAVGAVMVPADFDWSLLLGVGDSKALTEKNREAIFLRAWQLRRAGVLDFSVTMESAATIDRIGINRAIACAMNRALKRLEKNSATYGGYNTISSRQDLELGSVKVLLDGGLRAPERFVHQETIIKGDATESVISLASIVAKVTRDRYMRRLATLAAYAPYAFHIHKGYGTKAHRAAIAKCGLSDVHRKTYCKNIKVL